MQKLEAESMAVSPITSSVVTVQGGVSLDRKRPADR